MDDHVPSLSLAAPSLSPHVVGQVESVKSRLARRAGREEGFREALEEFVPFVVDTVRASHELLPRVLVALDAAVADAGRSEDVKNMTPLLKALFDQEKRLLDRLYGSSVQRQVQEVSKTVTHVNLRDLLGASSVEGEVL